MNSVFSCKTLLAFSLLHSVLQGQIAFYTCCQFFCLKKKIIKAKEKEGGKGCLNAFSTS